jgi:hypothetical protein
MNEDKTDASFVSIKDSVMKQLISLISLVVGGAHIFRSPVVRNLGVLLDSHLSMEVQINSSCKKAYYHLRQIARIKRFLSQSAAVQQVRAFVLSQLDYGNPSLVGLPAVQIAKLQ